MSVPVEAVPIFTVAETTEPLTTTELLPSVKVAWWAPGVTRPVALPASSIALASQVLLHNLRRTMILLC